jgi:DNA gyrase subunit A
LLPNALINGNFGIAPGVRTMTPTFTLQSVVKTLIATLKNGGKATPQICLNLEFITDYGGVMRKSASTKKELLDFFKTGKGRFTFDSVFEDNGKTIRFDRFAPIGNLDGSDTKKGYKPGLLDKIAALPGVDRIYNDTTTQDKYNAYAVDFKKSLSSAARELTIKKIADLLSGTQSYNVQVVDRRPDPKNPYGYKKLNMSNVPDMITDWIAERIELEKRACKFWIEKRNKEIDYLNLLRLAVKNRSFIIQALDKKLDDEQLAAYIAKGLKITIEQANTILDLKVRQLKALEDNKLVAKIKELKQEIADYIDRIKRPKSYIAKQIVKLGKELAA